MQFFSVAASQMSIYYHLAHNTKTIMEHTLYYHGTHL